MPDSVWSTLNPLRAPSRGKGLDSEHEGPGAKDLELPRGGVGMTSCFAEGADVGACSSPGESIGNLPVKRRRHDGRGSLYGCIESIPRLAIGVPLFQTRQATLLSGTSLPWTSLASTDRPV